MLVPGTGLEPARLAALDPKSSASANSAIPALVVAFTDDIVPPEKLCGLQSPISLMTFHLRPAFSLQPIAAVELYARFIMCSDFPGIIFASTQNEACMKIALNVCSVRER